MTNDYYKILEIDKNLPEDEFQKKLRKNYRKLSLELHPDKNPGDKEAEEKFKLVAEAYGVLSNKEKRQKYDMEQLHGQNQGFGSWDMFSRSGFSDFFGGFGNKRQQVERGNDIQVNLNVSLEDIYNQKNGTIKYNRHIPCSHCNGTGADGGKVKFCTTCGGSGVISKTEVKHNMTFITQTTCPSCNGKGQIPEKECEFCKGNGLEEISASIDIKIPNNVFDGSAILMEGHGDLPKTKHGIPGNLIVRFYIKNHDYFRISNGNLVHDEYVPFTDCILGCKLNIKTIDGKEKILEVPELTEDNSMFTFDDVGMWGKPYTVFIKHKYPEKLTKKQRKLLEDFSKD